MVISISIQFLIRFLDQRLLEYGLLVSILLAPPVLLALLGPLARLEMWVLLELQDRKVRQETQALRERQALWEQQEPQVLKETLEQ
jgi:hypothetical protein